MFKSFLILIMISIAPQITHANTEQCNPYKIMTKVTVHTFDRIQHEQKNIKQNPSYLHTIIQEELMPYIHVKYAAALILGRYYNHTTQAQRDSYYSAFSVYLSHLASQMLSVYQGQAYKITPEKPFSGTNIVTIRITILNSYGGTPIRLDFQWRKNSINGRWQAYDILTEGVSIISTKQNEWSHILRKQGIDGLTKTLTSYTHPHPLH
ncbi:Intermembrane phospholipid transport system binding protein MlaC [Candidatus Erwinia haradaeae]|uniref:Intermembrane phospholipid transport system binding protein MlaC n=1 Tax=Candidatus Erwinia haradaeae TaxID=1922217 RepID=A0A451DCG1_9GAMM|nr:phospholipid-binding protein MlaC [Candidatus Erwinia haradaeae]VFP84121.1 Intermembrane phospholipid transport system binding protein MlaC [Candidatus Erwinia haradaeae]